MKYRNIEIEIMKGDIADLMVDVCVIPSHVSGAVSSRLSKSLKEKGGQPFEGEVKEIGLGDVVRFQGGNLNAKHIFQAAVMEDNNEIEQGTIRKLAGDSLNLANKMGCETLAFSAIGCEEGGFPAVGSAKILIQEVMKFAREKSHSLKKVIFCLFDKETFQIFNQTIEGYVTHVINELGPGPYVTVDVIIEMDEGIILIERSNPPYGWALPGGFLDYGETLEAGAAREAKEETNMDLVNMRQMHTYSDPRRDPRFHTIATVFIAKGLGQPQFGDDAKGLKIVKYEDLLDLDYAFDHKLIIKDYCKQKLNA